MEFYHQNTRVTVDAYPDDTIEMVYYKLSVSLGCSIDDIYLFSSRHYAIFTSSEQFERLKMSGYDGIPAFHLENFYRGVNLGMKIRDEMYQEEDLDDLYDPEDKLEVEFPIAQDVRSAADPSKAIHLDQYREIETDVSTLEQRLLLDYMPFDNIHVCLKSDKPEYSTKAYANYFNHKPLNADAMKRQNAPLEKLFAMKYVPLKHGIKRIVCRLDPVRPMVIPLDTLFNYLHVSDEIPMIQYNTGNEENLMYKLLTKQVDLKGDKIPVLDETTVRKHDKSYKKSVTVFTVKKNDIEIIYGFMGNGSIKLEMNCPSLTVKKIDEAFLTHKNLLDSVSELMYKSGFVYPTFTTIQNAVIEEMDMFSEYKMTGKPRMCGNPFFIGSDDIRYKRVSRFNENELINELCVDYYNRGELDKIAPLISQILGITPAESRKMAQDRIAEMESSLQTNPNKRFVVKTRIGFLSKIKHINQEIRITVSGINSIYYMDSVQRNMNAYVAFQENATIQCQDTDVRVPLKTFVPIAYQQDFDSDSESDSEKSPKDKESDERLESGSDSEERLESGSDSDDEERLESGSDSDEERLESGSDSEQEGGAEKKDLDNIIKNTSFLVTRINETFKPSKDYVKECPMPRRPVVLKPQEIEHVPEDDHLRKHNGHTFVCTKYWDMENKRPLEEPGSKKVIDPNKVKGREVDFEKDGTIVHVQTGKYNPYPGIMRNSNGDAPCCFTRKQTEDRKEKKTTESKQYIVNGTDLNKPGQVGWLPKSMRDFFGLTVKDTHLLRYGIEKPHSFIQCIDTVFKKVFSESKKTLTEQIEGWVKSRFHTYNNGNLKRQFNTIDVFLKHLSSMDYTYLWEIVCDVFNVNLVVFREPEKDGKYLEVICPSNHYSTRSFDSSKQCLFILEHKGGAFEPLVEHIPKQETQIFLHNFKNKHLQEGIHALVQIFWKCKTTISRTPIISASEMYKKISSSCEQIIQDNKCIGFSVDQVFVPCYPSAILPNVVVQTTIPVISYESTVSKLFKLSKSIPCKPTFRVVEQGFITGIVLETQYFVPCTRIPDEKTDLPRYESNIQYEYTPLPTEEDQVRIQTTQRMKAEKCLYAACRRMLKEIIGKNAELRNKLNKLIRQKQVSVIEKEIRTILQPKIQFVDKTDESFIRAQIKCGGCCFAYDKLILPKHNLVTRQPNQYFSRLAEELKYYTRISTFIMNPQLLIPEVPFSVHSNELLLTYSTVHQYYASLMEPKRLPEYYTTFDNANPKHKPYKISILKVKKGKMITL
jgi:hypothetical protein